jgi:small subunit ribosomal protein S18
MSEELLNESEEVEEIVDDLYEEDLDDEDIPAADDEFEDEEEEEEEEDEAVAEGPTNFNRAKEGRRRNLRSLAREVTLDDLNYKQVQVLSRFVDRHGRILSRRKTRISAKMQRRLTREIKRARHLALMPYTREHVRITRKRTS